METSQTVRIVLVRILTTLTIVLGLMFFGVWFLAVRAGGDDPLIPILMVLSGVPFMVGACILLLLKKPISTWSLQLPGDQNPKVAHWKNVILLGVGIAVIVILFMIFVLKV